MPLLTQDRALLDAFRRGEREAIERVYHAYVGQVAGLLRGGFSFMSEGQPMSFHGIKDAWDLECAVQDTFIQAFSPAARQAYDGLKPYGPYLLAIARNRVISDLRSHQRERRRRSSLAAEVPPPGPESPERQAMAAQREQIVRRFCEGLPAKLLRFSRLRFEQDRNLMEAARALGLSRMKARTLELQLRKAFLAFLRDQGHLRGDGPPPALLLTLSVRP